MKIMVASRMETENLLAGKPLDERVAIVSIYGPPEEQIDFDTDKHTCFFHPVVFHDATRSWCDTILIDEEKAHGIASFIDRVIGMGVKVILCHCTAGISRSAAVAAATAKFYFGDDGEFFRNYVPNKLVHRLVLEAFHNLEQ